MDAAFAVAAVQMARFLPAVREAAGPLVSDDFDFGAVLARHGDYPPDDLHPNG
jgi:hypothetical protein